MTYQLIADVRCLLGEGFLEVTRLIKNIEIVKSRFEEGSTKIIFGFGEKKRRRPYSTTVIT